MKVGLVCDGGVMILGESLGDLSEDDLRFLKIDSESKRKYLNQYCGENCKDVCNACVRPLDSGRLEVIAQVLRLYDEDWSEVD